MPPSLNKDDSSPAHNESTSHTLLYLNNFKLEKRELKIGNSLNKPLSYDIFLVINEQAFYTFYLKLLALII